ncbi:hypothetical protein ACG11_01365 [Salmonella enterica subsp. enterica serovar Enteritidis]|nr:hypothetical protein ACG11_01365 [Salmonella enterica subsp. enterica serovar Enteritidis]
MTVTGADAGADGGTTGAGVHTPKEREVCAYYSLCDHSGTGTSAGLLFTLSTLMLIYHQEYQSLEGILMGHFLREWLIQMLVIKMIVINIQKV